MIHECFFQCSYCWEEVSMLLEVNNSQSYIEDYEVCYNPIKIYGTFQNNILIAFNTQNIEQ